MTFEPATLVRSQITQLTPYQPGKPSSELQRELGLAQIVKLASNENPLGTSPKALQAAQQALADSRLYPDPEAHSLKLALAERLSINIDQLTLGNGSDNLLALIAQAYLNPDDKAIMSQYAFATFAIVTQAHGGQNHVIAAKAWQPDLNAMLEAIDAKTKLIFIANPNNPTGTWLTTTELTTFLAKVPAHVTVVLDEAYYEFMQEADYPDSIALLAHYPQLIITRTFSKIYGLAGLRIGYSIASARITDFLNRIRLPFNVSSPAQAAALAALDDTDFVEQTRAVNRAGLIQMTQGLQDLGLSVVPSVTNFVLVDLKQTALPIFKALLQAGVIVRPLVPYGLQQHLRISIGTASENTTALTALAKVLEARHG